MNHDTDLTRMLSLIPHPAFCVRDGIITLCNSAAEQMLIQPDTSVTQFLADNAPTYSQFQNGCLFLTLTYNGHPLAASVTRMENHDVFVIEAETDNKELKTLSLAAAALRQPVSSVIATAGNLAPMIENSDNPQMQECAAQMNRQLWRIHRMLCNMSDTVRYANGSPRHMICQNITSMAAEVFQKAQELAQHCGVTLCYSIPSEGITCLMDDQLLERAIYNMISNALKSAKEGDSIKASLTCQEKRLYLSVEDQGTGIPAKILGSVFRHYLRQPGIGCATDGLGLGMTLIRNAAMVHGGTVLLDHPTGTGTRVTLSFPIRSGHDNTLASGVHNVDYAGGWDHGLLELSDVLPAHLYGFK